ncbi:MAG: LysE/ArgO family amino acid transporter [Corynebacterium sp.]|uniref:LysE/ArgO family amino acid transporter n=1 Tax=unclassified Corynebacterium TaxID=2624378 RepID=UPI00264883AD|nr:LysE family transporter [Corynebacterium sp.]MDN5581089.1 LysE family transporter [Corynebacterium sp.]MDN5721010.1 LysE family transporter [Corynebacterium sp.]
MTYDSLLPALRIALAGMVFQLSVIAAVGPQNIVLLKQGVKRWGVGLVISVFIVGDLILLPAGTAGVAVVTDRLPVLIEILRWGGVAYLLWFASTCLRDVRHPTAIEGVEPPSGSMQDEAQDAGSALPGDVLPTGGGQVATKTRPVPTRQDAPRRLLRLHRPRAVSALPTALAVTFLNPAAYVDGIVVFGTMANQYDPGKWVFTAGALVGSVLFFVVVGYGARLLSRPLSSPGVWRWINLGIGLLMIGMAARLALG